MDDHSNTRLSTLQSAESAERTAFCPEDQVIAEYYDDVLSETERDTLERHLADCSACRSEADFILLLREAKPDRMPGPRLGFEKRLEAVVTAAEERSDPRLLHRRVMRRLVAGVTVGVALLSGVLPSTAEILAAAAGIGWQGAGMLLGASGLVLLVSSPLLFARHRRMENPS